MSIDHLSHKVLAATLVAFLGLTTYQLLPDTVSGENEIAGMAGTSGTSPVSSQTTTAGSDNDALNASAGDTAMLGFDPVDVSVESTSSGITNTGNGETTTDTGDDAGDGASPSLSNGIRGTTAGNLMLAQSASGGNNDTAKGGSNSTGGKGGSTLRKTTATTGNNGTPGAAGTNDDPGTDGADGTAGDDANDDTNPSTDASNSSTANAGDGGAGGNGGTGVDGPDAGSDADGGNGGNGGAGGTATANAETNIASGTGSSTATANGGDGGQGGHGGGAAGAGTPGAGGNGGVGGDANASSQTTTTGSGGATVNATATAGNGGRGGNPGTGGTVGGDGGDGGVATLGTVQGTSGSGTVSVTGTIKGGNGGNAAGDGNAGSGADATLTNAIAGSTTGSLTLNQTATGGAAGDAVQGPAGVAGAASSSQTRTESQASYMELDSRATGGAGGNRNAGTGSATAGGAATAVSDIATSSGQGHGIAYATGGAGGLGLSGGGTAGGAGGTADATVTSTNTGTASSGSYAARTFSQASGGVGGYAYGVAAGAAGGDATSSVTAISTNTANTGYLWADGNATGGRGGDVYSAVGATGGQGGSAISSSSSTAAGNQWTYANDNARGGAGGNIISNGSTGDGGDGGDATSSASTIQTLAGNQPSQAYSAATGGAGGYARGATFTGGDGGSASTTANATGLGTGAVTSQTTTTGGAGGSGFEGATGGVGASVAQADSVSGSSEAGLTLNQYVTGGAGGGTTGGTAGAAGTATSTLTGFNGVGGNVTTNVTATGGAGGTATTSGTASDGAGVTVSGTGNSTVGGTVVVNVTGTGGRGGNASGTGTAADGASVALTNVTNGSTTGSLTLNQTATGGAAGDAAEGLAGTAGAASSSQTRVESAASFIELDSRATGGAGGNSNLGSGSATAGGAATAATDLETSSGTAYGYAYATGGGGGAGLSGGGTAGGAGGAADATSLTTNTGISSPNTYAAQGLTQANAGAGGWAYGVSSGASGGDATSSVTAISTNTANTGYSWTDGNATGGRGGDVYSAVGATGGQGGSAISSSSSTAAGNQWTYANDNARGGAGGNIISNGSTGDGGDGGDATSSASTIQTLAGNQPSQAYSAATGGAGGYARGATFTGGDGGSASTTANAVGLGTGAVTSQTTTTGGAGGSGFEGATGGVGASVSVADSVSGSSEAGLTLNQYVTGGAGGGTTGGTAGAAGTATSTLTGFNGVGGNVTTNVTATGGAGGTATTSGTASDGAGVTVSGTGNSTVGGTVVVNVTGTGGRGGNASGTGTAADGASVALTNVTNGSTTGSLTLNQTATGGAAGDAAEGLAGTAGAASSSQTRVESAASFIELDSRATGGAGGNSNLGSGSATAGGAATAATDLETSSGTAYGYAYATGGGGGAGLSGGGTAGGAGGAADATSLTTNTGISSPNTYAAQGLTQANAGAGGWAYGVSSGASGGDATSSVTAISTNTANTGYSWTDGNATGGRGGDVYSAVGATGGQGGSAISSSSSTAAGNQWTYANDNARGGAGGNIISNGSTGDGGDGGDATSSASTIQTLAGNQPSQAYSAATGGAGGYARGATFTGGDGGSASTTANAVGLGTGAVTSQTTTTGGAGGSGFEGATGGVGASVSVADSVSGSSEAGLTLNQYVTGGAGGGTTGGTAGAAGTATSTLTGFNGVGGNVTTNVTATGGAGGTATTSGTASDGAGVTVSGTGNSTVGGTVVVNVTGTGGRGGNASGTGTAADGASVALTNVTNGSTTGSLTLNQTATGGAAGDAAEGLAGTAGAASSSQTRVESAASFIELDSRATGGAGGNSNLGSGSATAGGAATAATDLETSSGTAYGYAYATGGGGGAGLSGGGTAGGAGGAADATSLTTNTGISSPNTYAAQGLTQANAGAGGWAYGVASGASGGDATSSVTAISTDTANTGYSWTDGNATGGRGGDVYSAVGATGGQGGSAISSSSSTAAGNQWTYANDNARGGAGGNIISGGTGDGGDGGNADSSASSIRTLAGNQQSQAYSTATGGAGGQGRGLGQVSGTGGDATATADASGIDFASADATATGGAAGAPFTLAGLGAAGSGLATATATGDTGSANSDAHTGQLSAGLVAAVDADNTINLAGAGAPTTVTSQSFANITGGIMTISDAQAFTGAAYATGAPTDQVVLPPVRNSSVLANFDLDGVTNGSQVLDSSQLNTDVFGYGVLRGGYTEDASGLSRTQTSSVDFDVDLAELTTGGQNLLFGFMNASGTGTGTVTVNVQIENANVDFDLGTTGHQALFTGTVQDAVAFFSNQTIDLGSTTGLLTSGDLDVDLVMTLTSATQGTTFTMDSILGDSVITPRAVATVTASDSNIVFANQRVNDVNFQGVEINNVAVSGSDGVDASFTGATAGGVTNGGTIDSLGPGASDGTSMQVRVDTTTAGAITGTAEITTRTDGVVTGTAEDFSIETITVSGSVFNEAAGALNPTTVAFGNYRVGTGALSADIEGSNNAPAGIYSEGLELAVNSAGTIGIAVANNAGDGNLIAAGASRTDALVVSSDGNQAGNIGGTVNVDFISDGTGTSGLADLTNGSDTITVTGTGYRLAEFLALADIDFGTIAVDSGPVTRTVSITNSAIADLFSEDLSAAFSGFTDTGAGDLTNNAGSIANLFAGQTDNASLTVTIDPNAQGTIAGTATISFASTGTVQGVSNGLGVFSLGTDGLDLTGTITGVAFNLAQAGPMTPNPVTGAARIGDTFSQNMSIANIAPVGELTEGLNADFGTPTNTDIAALGSITSLAGGETDSTSMTIGVDTSAAGNVAGSVALNLESDGSINLDGVTPLAGQTIAVDVDVFRLANPDLTTPVDLGNVRVGGAAVANVTITNNVVNDGFSEFLDANFTGTTAGDTSGTAGAIDNLGAAASDSTMTVTLDTTVAGAQSGTAEINFISDPNGLSSLTAFDLGNQDVTVNVDVFNTAAGALNPTTVDFGSYRVGTGALSADIDGANSAPAGAFSEGLELAVNTAGTTGIAVTNNAGDGNLIAAGANRANALVISSDGNQVGVIGGDVAVSFISDGTGTSGLADLGVGGDTITVSGTGYRLATFAALADIDFGTIAVGSGPVTRTIEITNTQIADLFSEDLSAAFSGFTDTGAGVLTNNAGSISNLIAGATDNATLTVTVDPNAQGLITGTATISFASTGTVQGVSNGLGVFQLGTDSLDMSGDITGIAFNLAEAGPMTPNPVTGAARIGDTFSQNMSIANIAPVGELTEGLDASFGTPTDAGIAAAGSIDSLAGGATDSSSMTIGVSTASAGNVAGSVAVNLQSDGSINEGVTALPGQTIDVDVDVFRLADALLTTPVDLGNVRVNDAAVANVAITNNVVNDGFSEFLDANFTGTTTGDTSGTAGAIDNLAAAASDSTMTVMLDTSVAGARSGTAEINFISDPNGLSSMTAFDLGNQDVTVNVGVYNEAAGALDPTTVAFGSYRVGTGALSANVEGTNSAPAGAFSEGLELAVDTTGTTGIAVANNAGDGNLIAAGANRTNALVVSSDGNQVGDIGGSVGVSFISDGTGTSGLADLGVGGDTITVSGTGYRLATFAALADIDFGTIAVGSGPVTRTIEITNTQVADLFSEDLSAAFSGFTDTGAGDLTNNGGSISNLIAGATDNATLTVTVDPNAQGLITGTATISFASTGTVGGVSNGLTSIGIGTDSLDMSGDITGIAFNLAEAGPMTPNPVTGAARIGDTFSQNMSIANIAPVGELTEGLDASFGTPTDAAIAAAGSIDSLAGGATDSSSMTIGVNTSAAGNVAGSVAVNLQSDGSINEGVTALPGQTIDVDVDVFRLAEFAALADISFGAIEVGSGPVTRTVSITNTAIADLFSEDLSAAFSGFTDTGAGDLTNNAGSIAQLFAGVTDNASLTVTIDPNAQGLISGTATISFASTGTVQGVSNGLGVFQLGTDSLDLSGDITGVAFNLAEAGPMMPNPVTGAARIGDVFVQNMSISNIAPTGEFTEGLDASFGTPTDAAIAAAGSIDSLAGGATDSSSMTIGVSTASAGNVSGDVAVNLQSDGSINEGVTPLEGQTIGVDVNVYAPAIAEVTPTTLDFGIARVGDVIAAQDINVANAATVTLLNDVLRETGRSVTGPFTVAASAGDIAAGDDANLATTLDTTTAGIFNGTATLDFASHNDEMADLGLGSQSVSLMGTVNNLATALFENVGGFGTLSGSGSAFTFDFGSIQIGSIGDTLVGGLGIRNGATGPADNLDGTFSSILPGLFTLGGFEPFFGLAAGDLLSGFNLSIDTSVLGLGTYLGSLQLNPVSSFIGLDDWSLGQISLDFRLAVVDDVVSVPEPPAYLLLLTGLFVLYISSIRRRRFQRAM